MAAEEPVEVPSPENVEAWTASIDTEPSVVEASADAWTAPEAPVEPSTASEDPFAAPFTPMEQSDEPSIAAEASLSDESALMDAPEIPGVPDRTMASLDDATPEPWVTLSEPAESEPGEALDPFATMAQPEGRELPVSEPVEAAFGADAPTDNLTDPFLVVEEGLSSDAMASSESGAFDTPEMPVEDLEAVAFSESAPPETLQPDISAPELSLDFTEDITDVPAFAEEIDTLEPGADLPDLEAYGVESPDIEVPPSVESSFDPSDLQPDLAGVSMSDRSFETPSSADPTDAAPLEELELNESDPDFSGPELPDLPPLAQPTSISQASIDTPSGNNLLEPLDEPLTLKTLLDRSGTRWMVPLGLILIIGVIGVIGFVALQNKSGDDTQQDQNSRLQPSNAWISRLPR